MQSADYNREFKESFIKIALPVGLQNLLITSLTFVDSLMVGQLGQAEFNAVSLGGQFYFIINLLVVGISSAAVIYMSQYYGNDDLKGYRKSAGLALIACLSVGLLAGLFTLTLPATIIRLFSKEPAIVAYGVSYLTIIAFQIPIMAINLPLSMSSRAAQNAKLPLIISSTAFSLNTVLNYLLIFGNFGFPELGVRGAALATLLSSTVGLILYIIGINVTNHPLHGSIKDFLNIDKRFVSKVFSTGWIVILHELFWSIGVSLFVLILSRFRTDGYTSYEIALKFFKFSFIFVMAIASSASVTIGMLLGRKDIAKARHYEKKYAKAMNLVSVFVAIIIVAGSYFFVSLFNVSASIKNDALYCAIIMALSLPVRNYSGLQIIGALRAGGDTKVPALIELFSLYLIDAPIIYLLLKYTNWSTPVVVAFGSIGSIVTAVLIYGRVKSGKWAQNLID